VNRYITYQSGNPEHTKRCWCVLEEDGTEDGRLVADTMTEEDARHVTQLLNKHERVRWCDCGQPWIPATGLYGTTEETECPGCVLRRSHTVQVDSDEQVSQLVTELAEAEVRRNVAEQRATRLVERLERIGVIATCDGEEE
jgi:hypothetical protein